MEDSNKKISFGFTKLAKKASFKPNLATNNKKIQLIDCIESNTIKLKDVVEETFTPLVIPMPKTNLTPLQRKLNATKQEGKDVQPNTTILTPDQLAAQELILEAQGFLTGESTTSKLQQLPEPTIKNEDKEESTLDDYENVPISEYGLAMLRGMGWTEETGIGKTSSRVTKMKEPNLRPKGMGLGANIAFKKPQDNIGEELVLKKGAYAKIIDGKQKGQYGEVQGFDEESGRIIIKTSLTGLILSLNEFLIVPVTKEEFAKSSKVLNIAKYEEYKESSNIKQQEVKAHKSDKQHRSSHENSSRKKDGDDYHKRHKDRSRRRH